MRIFWDRKLNSERVVIEPGEHHTAGSDRVIYTVLGSCVSVCLKDESTGLAGMNHFMLPEAVSDESLFASDSGRFGMHAMELLITELQQRGAARENLWAKVFGGGHILEVEGSTTRIPRSNVELALKFLEAEGIPVVSQDVGGRVARRVGFYTGSGEVAVSRFARKTADVTNREYSYLGRIVRNNQTGSLVLFDRRAR